MRTVARVFRMDRKRVRRLFNMIFTIIDTLFTKTYFVCVLFGKLGEITTKPIHNKSRDKE